MADNLNNILSNFFNENTNSITNTIIDYVTYGLTILIIIIIIYSMIYPPNKTLFFYIYLILFMLFILLILYNNIKLKKIDEDNRKDEIQSLIWYVIIRNICIVFITITILLTLKFNEIPLIDRLFNTTIGKIISRMFYILIGIFIGFYILNNGLSYNKTIL